MSIQITVNGCSHLLDVDPDKPLLWVLREDLGMTGTKYGCGLGLCRACSVLLDGALVQSCLYTASMADGKSLRTIEGLTADPLGQIIQDAWHDERVSQCGYCQPGQVTACFALLSSNPSPSDAEIRSGMPNLCRCGTYPRILRAVRTAADAAGGS